MAPAIPTYESFRPASSASGPHFIDVDSGGLASVRRSPDVGVSTRNRFFMFFTPAVAAHRLARPVLDRCAAHRHAAAVGVLQDARVRGLAGVTRPHERGAPGVRAHRNALARAGGRTDRSRSACGLRQEEPSLPGSWLGIARHCAPDCVVLLHLAGSRRISHSSSCISGFNSTPTMR